MTEARNRVVEVTRFGGPEGLEVVDAALPTGAGGVDVDECRVSGDRDRHAHPDAAEDD